MKKEEKEKAEKALGRENYLSFWLEEAQVHVKNTVISPVEALSIIKNSFTEKWLVEQITSKNKRVLPENNIHLLAQWIETPNPYQIHSVLELALLFKELCPLPRFEKVFEIMKTKEQFETALMQLAFAHKFLKAEARKIELEPLTDNGRAADIQFEYNGQIYVAECYVPQNEKDAWLSDFFAHSVERIGGSAQHFNKRVAVSIKLKSDNLTDTLRKQIQAQANDLIKDVEIELTFSHSDFEMVVTGSPKIRQYPT